MRQPHCFVSAASLWKDEVECENEKCPEGTGVMLVASKDQTAMCTAWIAGESEGRTLVVTDPQCLEKMANCRDEAVFRLPETNESAKCLRVVREKPALVMLESKLGAKPLTIVQQGLAPQSQVKIRRAVRNGEGRITMREQTCQTGAAGAVIQEYGSAFSPKVSLFNCGTKDELPGGPVLNERGEVAALADVANSSAIQVPRMPGLETAEFKPEHHGTATNMACADISELNLKASPNCTAPSQVAEDPRAPYSQAHLLQAIAPTYLHFLETDHSGIFGWGVRPDAGQHVKFPGNPRGVITLELTPKCILRASDKDSLLEETYRKPWILGWFQRWQSSGHILVKSPGWSFRMRLDKFGRANLVTNEGMKTASYQFLPQRLAELQEGQAVEVSEWGDFERITHRLPLCPAGFHARELRDVRELDRFVRAGDAQKISEWLRRTEEYISQ